MLRYHSFIKDEAKVKHSLERPSNSSFFDRLPHELILLCLQRLDAKSLVQLCIAYTEMSGLANDKSLCLHLCHNDPAANAFIKAAGIETELQDGSINAYTFLTSFVNKNFHELIALLSKKSRHFVLWAASYEAELQFFPPPPPGSPRPLFLTKEMGKAQTLNARKVKEWLAVNVPVNELSLTQLVTQSKMFYQESIPKAYIQRLTG